jgi:hypothetical protein
MRGGRPLKLRCKRVKIEMAVKGENDPGQISLAINKYRLVDESRVPIPTIECGAPVIHCVND